MGIVFFSTSCSTKTPLEKLREEVTQELSIQQGDFAVAFEDLKTGEQLLINEKETFHAASTMKTPVMIEVFKQVAEGNLSLEDSIEVKNQFKSISRQFCLSIARRRRQRVESL